MPRASPAHRSQCAPPAAALRLLFRPLAGLVLDPHAGAAVLGEFLGAGPADGFDRASGALRNDAIHRLAIVIFIRRNLVGVRGAGPYLDEAAVVLTQDPI